jgi:membrane fusion protein (multidrug efflux system)
MADQNPSRQPENDPPAGTGAPEAWTAAQSGGGVSRERAPFRRSPLAKWLLLVAIVVLAYGGVSLWRYFSIRESTDDAQIDGHIYPVSARVGGSVIGVLVDDNQYVTAGAVLVEFDTKDYRVALDRARADLAESAATLHVSQTQIPITTTTSGSQLSAAQAGVGVVDAAVNAAEKSVDAARAHLIAAQARVRESGANYQRAARDLERMKALVAKEEISQQQYDAAVAAAESLRAQVDLAEAQAREAQEGIHVAESQLGQQKAALERARADVEGARTAPQQVAASRAHAESSGAKVKQMEAAVEQSNLNLQYTTIRAPVSGVVSQRNVEVGQVIQPGQPLLSIVPLDDIWITANFKENELRKMHPGQRAVISVDAYGGRKYKGHVDSIAAATGARFSLLPPENATGNYVKVIQRVPVKIVLDQGENSDHLLRPGMSVVPTLFTD